MLLKLWNDSLVLSRLNYYLLSVLSNKNKIEKKTKYETQFPIKPILKDEIEKKKQLKKRKKNKELESPRVHLSKLQPGLYD